MRTRRQFLRTMSAALPSASLALAAQSAGNRRPNFLFLHTDDQRFDTIRALGNGQIRTPNMDRLVARGLTFTQATTQGGLTGAICMPSRAQTLTGHNLFRVHRSIVDRTANPDLETITLPEQLRRHGYQTFHTGKWHLGPRLHHRSFTAGEAIFFGGMTDQNKMPIYSYQPEGHYPKEASQIAKGYSSQVIADAAIAYLQTPPSQPFFLYAAFTSPHDPRTAPAQFASLYAAERMETPPNFLPQHLFDNGELKVRDELLAAFPRTPAEIRQHLADYYAMVSEVDHQIGRILDALEASGLADRTYIIFAGDNGLAVGQHGLMGKQNLYDHSLRVPLVLCGPNLAKGKRSDALCHLMDLPVTLAELAGAPLSTGNQPGGPEGISLLGSSRRQETIAAYTTVQRALRTKDWKLILYNVKGERNVQLFDLANDPWEMHNLAEQPKQQPRVARFRERLIELLRAAGDPHWERFAG